MTADNAAVLLSIRPEWTRLILSGEKMLEVRKSRPKLEPPFTCYIYQCLPKRGDWNDRDGKVVGEFTCDEIRHYPMPQSKEDSAALRDFWQSALLKTSALYEYSGGWARDLHGWLISSLTVYEKPLPLSSFRNLRGDPIRRAPQSWGYVKRRR